MHDTAKNLVKNCWLTARQSESVYVYNKERVPNYRRRIVLYVYDINEISSKCVMYNIRII